MVTRKKNRLERFFSLNQYRKRFSASKADRQLQNTSFTDLKEKVVHCNEAAFTHGSNKNLTQHLDDLKSEFAGQSELLYYHAKIVVLIRRGYKTDKNFERFNALWSSERKFLLKNLNTRWLISAADTYADFSTDPLEQTLALSSSLLINTIKLYETERFIYAIDSLNENKENIETLKNQRVDLFDGTSAFAVGTDDTLRNMRWRLDKVCKHNSILGGLLHEIFNRLQVQETAYSRFKHKHTRKKTAWW